MYRIASIDPAGFIAPFTLQIYVSKVNAYVDTFEYNFLNDDHPIH